MKRLFVIIMLALTVLSVGGVIYYSVRKSMSGGGASPEIRFAKECIDVSTTADEAELLAGVTAVDPEDGDVTESVMVESISRFVSENTVTVTYVAYDSQNHVSRNSREVHYMDYRPPHFTMSEPMIFMERNANNLLEGIGAEDAVDGDISLRVHASFDDTTAVLGKAGVHDVTLTVSNSLGDEASMVVPVKVVEESPHSERIPLKTYLVYIAKGSAFNPRDYLTDLDQASTDKRGSPLQISSNVNGAQPGVYAVDYSLVNNEITTAQTRLIVVVE